MSASLQWVAIRITDTPRSETARMSSAVPIPGSSSAAIRARRAAATAVAISSRSGVAEKPYVNELPPSPSPWVTSSTWTPASSSARTTACTWSVVNR
jgi:hypothetical protein